MITNKEHIINYFNSGIKEAKDFKIGIEHEKFLFDQNKDKRAEHKYFKMDIKPLYINQ